ncbi:galanin receptor type 1-like [Gigantopelta aegis]|uniref:galanin receptor type 1-like n=1 Tax=Gigantopelta aegis TaxID=1735272 RepID=UPI001B88AEEA|nr:galanin receptor type 1-like [Gigantopelta aegis]
MKDFTNVDISAFVVYVILFCIGIPGNLVIVLRVVMDRKLHSPTFIVISSLAVADFLFLGCRIPLEILHLLNVNWVYGRFLCKMSYFLNQTASYSAAYHLVLMAVIRYYLLVHPFSAVVHLTTKRACLATLTIWVLTALLLLPVTVTSDIEAVECQGVVYTYCTINPKDHNSVNIFVICYSIFSYALPLVIITVLHSIKARAVARAVRDLTDKKKRQMSTMVVLVIMLFGVLLLPVHVKNLVSQFVSIPLSTAIQATDLLFRSLAYTNSCINPLVYAFLSAQFRKSLKRMCRCTRVNTSCRSNLYQLSAGSSTPNHLPLSITLRGSNATDMDHVSAI